jgi:hypothetical protein
MQHQKATLALILPENSVMKERAFAKMKGRRGRNLRSALSERETKGRERVKSMNDDQLIPRLPKSV